MIGVQSLVLLLKQALYRLNILSNLTSIFYPYELQPSFNSIDYLAGIADHVVLGNTVAFLEVTDLMAGKVR